MMVSISVDANHSYSDIVRSIATELQRQISARVRLKEFGRSAWEFMKKWEIEGVRFRDEKKQDAKDTELVARAHSVSMGHSDGIPSTLPITSGLGS